MSLSKDENTRRETERVREIERERERESSIFLIVCTRI